MWFLYATQEEMKLAQCELTYLTNLVSFFKNNTHYSQLANELFLQLSKFHGEFANKMNQLELLFKENYDLFVQNKELEWLETIYMDCKKTRDCFHTIHKLFLTELDNLIKDKLMPCEALIKETIQQAEQNIVMMKEGHAKSELEQSIDYLKINTRSLLVSWVATGRSINQLSITHEKIDRTWTMLQRGLEQIENFYSIELTQLHFQIMSTLNFDLNKIKSTKRLCKEILVTNKTSTEPGTLKHTLWNNNPQNTLQQKEIECVVQFITKKMSFFYAPFNPNTKRLFTRWSNANAKEMSEVSNGLRKHLTSERAIEQFSDALFLLKEAGDTSCLEKLLARNKGLLRFLKECADFPYPIIAKWSRRHQYNPARDGWDHVYSVYKI